LSATKIYAFLARHKNVYVAFFIFFLVDIRPEKTNFANTQKYKTVCILPDLFFDDLPG